MSWQAPTLEELRADYALPDMCFCTGACFDQNGVRGDCPLIPAVKPSFHEYLAKQILMTEVFQNAERGTALRRILAALAEGTEAATTEG
jgi:hypothetical protein